jgi:hypothetical protein
MTPPAAAAAPARTRTRRVTPPPRRVSGPARPRAATAGATTAPPPLALRLGGAVHGLAEHHLLDRLVRGRAWIAILAAGLLGIVFMQVSMLRMNAGITQAIEQAGTLERRNAGLRAAISELSSGDRIAAEATKLGLVLPAVTPRFLDGRQADARRAVSSISAPGENVVPSVAAVPVAEPVIASEVPVLEETGVVAPTPDPTATTTEAPVAPTPEPVATTAPATPPATATAPPPAEAAPPPAETASTGGLDAPGQDG